MGGEASGATVAGMARGIIDGAVLQGGWGQAAESNLAASGGQRGLDAPTRLLSGWRQAARGRLSDACNKFSLGLHILEAVSSFPGRLGKFCAVYADNDQTTRDGARFRDVLPLPEPPSHKFG